jgi:fructose-bisphosphate aldolase class II
MTSLADIVPSGVVTGDDLMKLLEHARANSYAIPAVNCTRYVRSTTAGIHVL